MKNLRFTVFFIFLLGPGLLSAQNSFKKVKEELIFQDRPFSQFHASALLETTTGDILAARFCGTHESW